MISMRKQTAGNEFNLKIMEIQGTRFITAKTGFSRFLAPKSSFIPGTLLYLSRVDAGIGQSLAFLASSPNPLNAASTKTKAV